MKVLCLLLVFITMQGACFADGLSHEESLKVMLKEATRNSVLTADS